MKITWHIGDDDLARVRSVLERTRTQPFVTDRQKLNVDRVGIDISRNRCWYVMVGCLLTTQHKSSLESPISKFLQTHARILNVDKCATDASLDETVLSELKDAGIGRAKTIAREIVFNRDWLQNQNGWGVLIPQLQVLKDNPWKVRERKVAEFVDVNLLGFGPKQARNFLQWLGVSQYEIPLDSRVASWLNAVKFPIPLNGDLLGDAEYYEFILDRLQELCEKAGVLPCMFDAAIFADADMS